MGFAGMDIVAIGHLSRQLAIQAEEVQSAQREIDHLTRSTEWSGKDREDFLRGWDTELRVRMTHASQLLRDASNVAIQESRRQDDTSRRLQ